MERCVSFLFLISINKSVRIPQVDSSGIQIMADKGQIKGLPSRTLDPFLKDGKMSPSNVASLRIHVERQAKKVCYLQANDT